MKLSVELDFEIYIDFFFFFFKAQGEGKKFPVGTTFNGGSTRTTVKDPKMTEIWSWRFLELQLIIQLLTVVPRAHFHVLRGIIFDSG